MFLKHKTIQVVDECIIHKDCLHDFEFYDYNPNADKKEKIIIRLRCCECVKAKLNDWDYYRVSVDYWLGFLITHHNQDFTSAT